MIRRQNQLLLGLFAGALVSCSQGGSGVAINDSTLVLSGKIENATADGLFLLEQVKQNKLVPFDTKTNILVEGFLVLSIHFKLSQHQHRRVEGATFPQLPE